MNNKFACVYYSLFFVSLFFVFRNVHANELQKHTKLWTNMPISGNLTRNQKWKYYIEPQLRLIDDKYKFDQVNLFIGAGYQVSSALKFWLGLFRRYQIELNGSSHQEYRLWEQMDLSLIDRSYIQLSSRSRLEERKNFIRSQIANRFREKLTAKYPFNDKHRFLVLSDEIFVQLNKPEWVTNRTISENRASIGIRIPIKQFTAYEIGYLIQTQYGKVNQLSNVLYFTLYVDAG